MTSQILGIKNHMMQAWTKSGQRIPVTVVKADSCFVVGKATKEGYLLVGTGRKKLKNVNKPQQATLIKGGFSFGLRVTKEVIMTAEEMPAVGTQIKASDVFTVGDIVKVTGISKGKGFAGVMKRHGFAGAPRTHGISDRERAPGSLGSGTTPGRVFKNKRMAGRDGNEQVTVEGLQVVAINEATGEIWIKGLVPGARNGVLTITKVSQGKFDGLLDDKHAAAVEVVESVAATQEETAQEDVAVEEAPVAQESATEEKAPVENA